MKKITMFFCACILCVGTSLFAAPPFSKVIIFGDSLSDVGNNLGFVDENFETQPGAGKAPVTNMTPTIFPAKGPVTYHPGNVWVVPFVEQLQHDGLLEAPATEVIPSRCLDATDPNNKDCPAVTSSESLDFAYSGDPTGGITPNNVDTRHFFYNISCFDPTQTPSNNDPNKKIPPANTSNQLCGLYNRVTDFIGKVHPTLTPASFPLLDPDALYVVWIGANDLEQEFFLLPQSGLGGFDLQKFVADGNALDPYDSKSEIMVDGFNSAFQAISNTFSAVNQLARNGAKYFVVINRPNLAYTHQGYALNQEYNQKHPSQPDAITQLFTNFVQGYTDHQGRHWDGYTDGLNQQLQNIKAAHPGIVIVSIDLNQLFDMMRNGEIKDFNPQSLSEINKNPVLQWRDTCCYNQKSEEWNYDPTKCVPAKGDEALCDGPIPKLPASAGGGSYLFFNDIHPTTCAHKYIAAYFSAQVEKQFSSNPQPFDPTADLCPEGY